MIDKFALMHGMHSVPDMECMFECMSLIPDEGWVVNLGVYHGKSCMVFCEGVGSERVCGIDNWKSGDCGGIGSSQEKAEAYCESFGYNPTIVTGDSAEVPDFVDKVACVFLDTKHKASRAREELVVWEPLLVTGGVVMLHDYHDDYPDYRDFIDEHFRNWRCVGARDRTVAYVGI